MPALANILTKVKVVYDEQFRNLLKTLSQASYVPSNYEILADEHKELTKRLAFEKEERKEVEAKLDEAMKTQMKD